MNSLDTLGETDQGPRARAAGPRNPNPDRTSRRQPRGASPVPPPTGPPRAPVVAPAERGPPQATGALLSDRGPRNLGGLLPRKALRAPETNRGLVNPQAEAELTDPRDLGGNQPTVLLRQDDVGFVGLDTRKGDVITGGSNLSKTCVNAEKAITPEACV